VPQGAAVDLVFDGLDTFATVKLDGEVILTSDNMFLGHRVNVTKALEAEGDHTLEIEFDCAMLKARELRAQDPDHKWVGFNGDQARLAVRKAQYHWGWDWGPVLMTAGIWRPVTLEVYTARVVDLWPQTQLAADHQSAEVTATAKFDTASGGEHTARFSLSLNGNEIATQDIPVSSENQAEVTFRVNRPELWWPHGYGEQTLYDVSVSLHRGDTPVVEKSKRFGIRTAEVIQQPDKHGKSFYFRVNGMDVFCGGSCWIPADSLLTNVTAERYRKWIELMIEGRQIMIRYVTFHTSAKSPQLTFSGSGVGVSTRTMHSMRPVTNWVCWSGRTSCSAVEITRHGLRYSSQFVKKQFTTSSACDTILQLSFGSATMRTIRCKSQRV
jgi:beta-mannosidase